MYAMAHTPQMADGGESDRLMQLSVQTSAMEMGVRQYYHTHNATLPSHVKFQANMRLRELALADTSVLFDSECMPGIADAHRMCLDQAVDKVQRKVLSRLAM
jgi:hypothetical protein